MPPTIPTEEPDPGSSPIPDPSTHSRFPNRPPPSAHTSRPPPTPDPHPHTPSSPPTPCPPPPAPTTPATSGKSHTPTDPSARLRPRHTAAHASSSESPPPPPTPSPPNRPGGSGAEDVRLGLPAHIARQLAFENRRYRRHLVVVAHTRQSGASPHSSCDAVVYDAPETDSRRSNSRSGRGERYTL